MIYLPAAPSDSAAQAGERLSKGKRQKASQGGYVGGWLPYGYRPACRAAAQRGAGRNGDGRISAVPEEAKVVEQVFRWGAEGKTPRWIAGHLNEQGVKTQKGGPWQASTIQGMLGNRFYTGRVEFEGTRIRAQHDAIVSDVLAEACR